MRFSLHQQNHKPNSTAGRHKAGGINLAGASHPQLPKAQYARGPGIHHRTPVLSGVFWKGLSLTAQRIPCGRGCRTHCEQRAEQAPTELYPTLPHTNSTSQGGKGGTEQRPTARDWTASSKASPAKGNWGGLTDKGFYWVLSRCHLRTSWYSHTNILQSLIVKRNFKKKSLEPEEVRHKINI